MRPCQRCGTERTPSGYCGAQGQHAVCALRAELRDVKEERDALAEKVALHERRQVIFEESDRDLRSAVLLIAKRMEDGGPASSDLLCIWANELRKAVT